MVQKLEILVTEDNVKHLADAKSVIEHYVNINFTFASTLQEAEHLVRQNRYDAGVTDLFFPAKEGDKPSSDSGLNLAEVLDAQGIPFVFLTAGNHHGNAYSKIRDKLELGSMGRRYNQSFESRQLNFRSGQMIEGYPEDANAEKDTKQWDATISYVILLVRLQEFDESVRKRIHKTLSANYILGFAPWGDYGLLTKKMQELLDESIPPSRDGDVEALKFIRTTLAEYRK